MQIKEIFEKETGFKIKELRYLKPPQLPYFLFTNKQNHRGADLLNNIVENNITIERYSETNNEKDLEEIKRVDEFLNKNYYQFESETEWLNDEELYGTFWVLEPILEKKRKDEISYGKEN